MNILKIIKQGIADPTEVGRLKADYPDMKELPIPGMALINKLIELGVIPKNVTNVNITIPLDGVVAITCTFYPDSRFEQAASEIASLVDTSGKH